MFSDKSKAANAEYEIKIGKSKYKQEAHCWFYDWIRNISYEGWNRQPIYYILIKEEYLDRHYKGNIRIYTNGSTRDT